MHWIQPATVQPRRRVALHNTTARTSQKDLDRARPPPRTCALVTTPAQPHMRQIGAPNTTRSLRHCRRSASPGWARSGPPTRCRHAPIGGQPHAPPPAPPPRDSCRHPLLTDPSLERLPTASVTSPLQIEGAAQLEKRPTAAVLGASRGFEYLSIANLFLAEVLAPHVRM